MKLEIAEEKENKFFNRRDLMVKIKHDGTPTPSKAALTKELSAKYKVDDSQVLIDYIFTMHGIGESTAKVRILNEKPKVEEKPKTEEKKEEKAEEQASEQPAEQPTEQKEEGEKVEAQAGESQ